MKKIKYILLISFLTTFMSYGQNDFEHCDSIIDFPDKEAELTEYESTLDLVRAELLPILNDCILDACSYLSIIYISLVINSEGKVVNVEFIKTSLPEKCLIQLEKKLMNTEYWSPGKVGGVDVCSKLIVKLRIELF